MPNLKGPARPLAVLLWTLTCSLLVPLQARAREVGIATEGCLGCHRGGEEPTVTIGLSPSTLNLGQTVRLSVTIAARNGNKAGVYLQATPSLGTLKLVSGQPTKLSGDNGATHTMPKSASGDGTTFLFDWTAPSQPGGVEFTVFALSANGDRTSNGDGEGFAYSSLAFGCTPVTFYPDRDGDGDGAPDGQARMACSAPPLFAPTRSDCNDYDERVLPGATELCNSVDDDCDGQVDEGLPVVSYCEDKDGDGHGVRSALSAMGCKPGKGFGLCDNDCDDTNPTRYPGAQELCNYQDDNCNERVDDGAKQTCGEGWCRRASENCTSSLCTPGPPRPEQCNYFDDDCDGVIDNGEALCAAGKACVEGTCRVQPPGVGGPLPDAGAATGVEPDATTTPGTEAPSDAAAVADSAGCSLGHSPRRSWYWLALGVLGLVLRRRRQVLLARGTARFDRS